MPGQKLATLGFARLGAAFFKTALRKKLPSFSEVPNHLLLWFCHHDSHTLIF